MESPSVTDFLIGFVAGMILRDVVVALAKYGVRKTLELYEAGIRELEAKLR